MSNSINLSILIPLIPLGMTLFMFILLRTFNTTINRLTKPVSYLIISSILISSLLSLFFLSNHIEGKVLMSTYSSFLDHSGIELHLNKLNEEILLISGIITSLILGYSVLKLPRQKGYVLYVVFIGLITSFINAFLLVLDF